MVKMKKKKKVRVYGKVDLMEISVVGIPSYPYAHLNYSSSLVKALHSAFDKPNLNLNVKNMSEEETQTEEEGSTEAEESAEAEAEAEEPEKPEETEEEKQEASEEESKEDISEEVEKLVSIAVTKELKRLSEEKRGLVDKGKIQELCKKAEPGELAMALGLFQVPETYKLP